MAGDVTVRDGWQLRVLKDREMRHSAVPTMADTGEVDLRGFLRTVYRRKLMLSLTIVAVLGLTLYWVSRSTPRYTADALIVIQSRPSSIVKVDEAVQDVSIDDTTINTEVAILESRGLADRVIQDLGLDQDPEFAPQEPASGLRATLGPRALLGAISAAWEHAWSLIGGAAASPEAAAPETAAPADEESQERAALLDQFLAQLSVVPEEKSRLINISFTSVDAEKAARITNSLVDAYIENQLETKTEGARRAAEWLQLRLAELGETVQSLEQSVQRQRTETGLAESNGANIVAQRLSQLNTQLVVAQAASAATKARYQQVQAVLASGGNVQALPSVLDSSSIQSLRARQRELIERFSELQTTFGDRHPQMVSLEAELAEVEQRLVREIDNVLSGLQNELDSARMHEAVLRTELESAGKEMIRLNAAEVTIGQAAQRLRANRDLYESLLKRYTEAVALRDNQQPDARIISSAQVPLAPSYPDVPRVIALAFVGSAGLAVLLLVVTERLRQKLDTVEDVERHVGLQVIGAIPDLPRLRRLASAPGDYIQREPLSEFGGAFQRLRALLTLSNNRQMPRTVLVTSGSSGEGKTTIAVCLGIASISSGQKVLLVDCDFARPQVHRMVNVKNDKGLTDILRGTATLEETITPAVGYRLSILSIGCSREGAIDLLNSRRMEELLYELKTMFDVIILDSAPVLEVSNALILGGLAEKTVLVTRREWTAHRKASYAAKQLHLYGADIAGVVFNRTGTAGNYAG
jgi:succinoglycan biosynthesis transport protein ExoP